MNKAIQDCEANITRLVDELHVVSDAIKYTADLEDLTALGHSKTITQAALQGEYDKLRRLQSEQAIIEAQQ